MIFPENTVLVPKVIGWISQSLARATPQLQEPYIAVKETLNPLRTSPWALPQTAWVIELPDAYIFVKPPANANEYDSPKDRLYMAAEAAKQTQFSLAGLTWKQRQDPDDFSNNLLRFYEQLYTWNTDAFVVDKVHPEDIVRHILFNQPAPLYSARAPFPGMINPDLFLVGSRSYDLTALSANLSQYSSLDVNAFIWNGNGVSFLYPGFGYHWDTSDQSVESLGFSRGISYSVIGYLVSTLPANQRSLFLSQDWSSRVNVLTSGAIYCNAYFSYLIRQVINS